MSKDIPRIRMFAGLGKTEGLFTDLPEAAKKVGANSVINVKLTSGTYEAHESKWNETYLIAYGGAVILIDE